MQRNLAKTIFRIHFYPHSRTHHTHLALTQPQPPPLLNSAWSTQSANTRNLDKQKQEKQKPTLKNALILQRISKHFLSYFSLYLSLKQVLIISSLRRFATKKRLKAVVYFNVIHSLHKKLFFCPPLRLYK